MKSEASMYDTIYCYHCDKGVTPVVKANPDFTVWICPLCNTELDCNFTDEEIEWEDEDDDEN